MGPLLAGLFFLAAAPGSPASTPARRELRLPKSEGLPSLAPVVRAPPAEPSAKLSPGLRAVRNDGAPISFLVDLRDQLDLRRAAARLEEAAASRQARRSWIIAALDAVALASQRGLEPVLQRLRKQGLIESWAALSIVNRVVVRGRPDALRALARNPEVASLVEEIESEGALEDEAPDASASLPEATSWPIEAMAVRHAWAAGVDGSSIVVGLIDSGATDGHEQLRDNFRGGPRSWFDPLHRTASPSDVQLGHGTAVLACAVGRAHGGEVSGAAPGARWIAAVGLADGRYNNLLLSRAADWMLRVGQPDVLVAPWRLPGRRCDASLRPMVDAFRVAGTVLVFAAGNSGPESSSDVSPANYQGPGGPVLSVGAVDREQRIHEHSSRGPNSCGGGLFPQLVAPGAGVAVALPAGASLYREGSGTSFAAGYVAGAAALLLQRCPGARADQVEEALRSSARDLGPPGPDATYGHGLVDVPAAIAALQRGTACR